MKNMTSSPRATLNYKVLTKSTFTVLRDIVLNGTGYRKAKRALSEFYDTYRPPLRRSDVQYLCGELDTVLRRIIVMSGDKNQRVLEGLEQLQLGLVYDKVVTVCRVVCGNIAHRAKKKKLKTELNDPNCLFFVCSVHYPCAVDHQGLQGKIYIDQSWRRKAKGSTYRAISEYVRAEQIMTVQEVMSEPYWLITRRNCKHKLYPIETATVLNGQWIAPRQRNSNWTKSVRDELRRQVNNIIKRTVK